MSLHLFFDFVAAVSAFFTLIDIPISLTFLFGLLLSASRATLPPDFDSKLPLPCEAHSNGI